MRSGSRSERESKPSLPLTSGLVGCNANLSSLSTPFLHTVRREGALKPNAGDWLILCLHEELWRDETARDADVVCREMHCAKAKLISGARTDTNPMKWGIME